MEDARKYSQICMLLVAKSFKDVDSVTYSEPSVSILCEDFLLIGHPVSVPSPESSRVVYTNRVNTLDFPSGTLEGADIVVERSRSISSREDVLVHEKTPNQILVLPALSQTSNLEVENTVILQHIIALLQERSKMSDTNVLGHFETGDLVVLALGHGNVAIIHAQNIALLVGNTGLAKSIVTPGSLVTTKCDTSSLGAIVDTSKFGQGSPSATNIEESLALLEINLLADDSKLIILQLLKSLLLVDVRDNAGCVDHAWA